MAFRDWFPFAARNGHNRPPTNTDIMRLGMDPSVARDPRPLRPPTIQGVSSTEFGVSGTENFGGIIRREDFNPDLDDWRKAVLIYDKMRKTDSAIRAMLQVIKLPLRGATWTCEAPTTDPVDEKIAEFCNTAIFEDNAMQESWDSTLRHILMQLEFGFSVLEKVWKVDEDGHYRFKRLAPRLPRTIYEWHTDRNGNLLAIVQYAPVPHSTRRVLPIRQVNGTGSPTTGQQYVPVYSTSISYQYITIPAEYAAVFVLEREGDNYQGQSLLRNVYRNWFFKDEAYRVMGVGLDRWGVGIPLAKLEDNHGLSTADLDTLREVLEAIRSNEKAYLVAPPHVDFTILNGSGGGGSGTAGHFGISWIEHNDSQIARNVLAGFLTMGRDTHGTLGFGSRLTDMFISSLNGIAAGISSDLKRQLIKPLCDFNFDMSRRKYPEPKCLDLEQTDLTSLLNMLAQLTGTIITPQDDDEAIIRKMLGMPKLDPKNAREKPEPVKSALDAANKPDAAIVPDALKAAVAARTQARAGAKGGAAGAATELLAGPPSDGEG